MVNKKILLFLVFLFSINFILAECIDINSASTSELDEIKWVGPTTAENIINSRPFDSVDDLIKVSGIGDIKLQDIKDQGLACVIDADNSDPEDNQDDALVEDDNEPITLTSNSIQKEKQNLTFNTIDLNTDSNTQKQGKSNYFIYGLVIFGIVIVILLFLNKARYKNEFR